MQDAFTGNPTCLQGRRLPGPEEGRRLQHDHRRRLVALDRLGAAAEKCGIREDTDRDLVLLAEDEIILLEGAGGEWSELGEAIRAWRSLVPLLGLEVFGFPLAADNPLEETNPRLRRIGGGVEAWAYAAEADGSVYKFYLPREAKSIGSTFAFRPGEESALLAEATLGDYRALLEKLLLIEALGGMGTEVVALTPEGILVAKQALGEPLPQGGDVSRLLPSGLIEIPSRFLRANRDHPRLFFHDRRPWLVADLHARNFVRTDEGDLRLIDLVACPWPAREAAENALMMEWLRRVEIDPRAGLLLGAADEEL